MYIANFCFIIKSINETQKTFSTIYLKITALIRSEKGSCW